MMKLKNIIQQLVENGKTNNDSDDDCHSKITLSGFVDTDDEIDNFIQALENSHVKSIHFSTDFLMQMEEENVIKFFNALGSDRIQTVEELHIQSSSRFHMEIIPSESLLPLRYAKNLKLIEMQDMQVTASHKAFIYALAKAMENHPTVHTIVLPNFFANDFSNTTNDILDCLILACSTMPSLTKLELTGCGSHALSGQVVRLLSTDALNSLLQSTTLRWLQLSFLELTDDHFESLIGNLSRNNILEHLALDYHTLQNRGFKSMMLAMEDNMSVKSLSLRSLTDIGLDGFAQIMLMLQYNYTVETLSVTASPAQQAEIDLYLRMNGAGRKLLRDPSVTMNEWVEILARHSDDLDVTRHLLAEVPGLCNSAVFAASERRRRSSIAAAMMSSTSSFGYTPRSS
jgi:hypothetical protein